MPSCNRMLNAQAKLSDLHGRSMNASAIQEAIDLRAIEMGSSGSKFRVVEADNSIDWVIEDLASQRAGMGVLPIPAFFTPTQRSSAIAHAEEHFSIQPTEIKGIAGSKITFTSGSTGCPKGVVLSTEEQWDVARMIARQLSTLGLARHLVLLPLSVLLENLAGVYVGLMLGAEVVVPSLAEVGLTGSSGFRADIALDAIDASLAQSVILLPEMLRQVVDTMKRTHRRLQHLRFVAVGGGKVPPSLIREARALGLPVFEGYGLSELGSVVSLNRPGADRLGSVGRPLNGRLVKIADDGEILVQGFGTDAFIATGDLGFLDSEGFLFVNGRKKNLLITGFGRNVSPEWPESVLLQSPEIAQVLVYGEGDPQLSALIVPVPRGLNQEATSAAIAAEIERLNLELPDYAQIGHWRLLNEPFTVHNGLATANGRLRRDAVFDRYLTQPILNQGALA